MQTMDNRTKKVQPKSNPSKTGTEHLENILRSPSLPIGALLVLEVGDKELFHSRPISGAPRPTGLPQLNLLDGQQRMTALWKSLNDLCDDFTVFVSLKNEDIPMFRS